MGTDSDTLMWEHPPRPARGPKPGLSLDRIATEAIALADEEGLEGLSMKRLAARLNSGVMSLYRYFPGKDELIALMLDTALGDPPDIPDGMPWRDAAWRCAMALRDFLHTHPWTLPLLTRARSVGPNETGWLEAELKALSGLNVGRATALNLSLTVTGYVRGAVAPELYAEDGAELRFSFLDYPETHTRYPILTETLATSDIESDGELDTFFEFGLTRVLDGIAAGFETSG